MMKFELNDFHRNVTDDELINDLIFVNNQLLSKHCKLTYRSYNENGKYAAATIQVRFKTWNNALIKAGIEINEEKNVLDENLFLNLENLWIEKGSQPVYRDLNSSTSKYTASIYAERFGNWRNALEVFVKYINEDEKNDFRDDVQENPIIEKVESIEPGNYKHKTSRNISDRMRFRVLSRDGFTCQSCGASPIKERGIELHVDHIIPWSKGGETFETNLQTKCQQCNLGKGNAFLV